MSKLLRLIALMSLMLLAVVPFAVKAQDAETEDGDLVVVLGTITFSTDEAGESVIYVGGYKVAPAGAFKPSDFEDGDAVILTGVLLPDGETIQAVSLELNENDASCADPETADVEENCADESCDDPATADVVEECVDEEVSCDDPATADVVEECVDEEVSCDDPATADVVEECVDEEVSCDDPATTDVVEPCEDEEVIVIVETPRCEGKDNHPVANRIANTFDVTYDEVISLFCQGYGFGEITLAYSLAEASGQDLEAILALRESGMGWGKVRKALQADGEFETSKLLKRGPKFEEQTKIAKGNADKAKNEKGNNGKGNSDKGNDKSNNGKGSGKK